MVVVGVVVTSTAQLGILKHVDDRLPEGQQGHGEGEGGCVSRVAPVLNREQERFLNRERERRFLNREQERRNYWIGNFFNVDYILTTGLNR